MIEAPEIPKVLTVGEIARRLGVPIHKVEYVIRARAMQPISKAGNVFIYSPDDLEFIRGELKRIAQERTGT